jgi:hypothetical protein
VQVGLDSVARFYRAELARLGWQILSDAADGGQVNLYATERGRALWVHIRAVGPLASEFTLIAGAAGPAAASPPAPAPNR